MQGRKPDLEKHPERHVVQDGAPECPDWLKGDARTEWERIVPELSKKRLIGPVDAATLAAYCKAYASWKKAEQQLDEDGQTFIDNQGNIKIHPLAKLAVSYLAEIRRISAEFGFSPAARSRINVPAKASAADDELDKFMGKE